MKGTKTSCQLQAGRRGRRKVGGDILDLNAKIAAGHLAGLDELVHERPGPVDRNGEADPL